MIDNFSIGQAVQISFGNVQDLEAEVQFFQKLGFKLLGRDIVPYPWANLFDGAVRVVLNGDDRDYVGITYFAEDILDQATNLQDIVFVENNLCIGSENYKTLQDPSGVYIHLIPQKPNSNTIPVTNIKNPVFLDRFGEFAIPVANIDESIAFWEKLGYQTHGRYTQPYNWAILTDREHMVIGLHQTTMFEKPHLTYFAKDMSDKIKNLESIGVKMQSFGGEQNKIATSPNGHKVNLFTGQLT